MTDTIIAFIIGGVVTLVFSFTKDWLVLRLERKSRAHYLAICVAVELEQYIRECFIIAKNKEGFSEIYKKGIPLNLVPPPIYATDIDWKSIDHELAYDILSLQSETILTKRQLDYWRKMPEVIEDSSVVDAAYNRCVLSGYEAIKIVKIIHTEYKLPSEGKINKSFEDTITKAYKKSKESVKLHEENK